MNMRFWRLIVQCGGEMKEDIVQNTTCFEEHKKRSLTCDKSSCRNWMKCEQHLNCAIIASDTVPWILQDIGDIFGVTRMRICQIEKDIIGKLAKSEVGK